MLEDRGKTVLWGTGIATLVTGLLIKLMLASYPELPNMVWATVESSTEVDSGFSTKVLFAVEDGEYTGTYRSTFQSPNKYKEDDVIYLYATVDYSRVFDEDYYPTVNKVLEYSKLVCKGTSIAGVVILCFAFIYTLSETDILSNIHFRCNDNYLIECIRDVRRIAKKCECKPYRETLLTIIRELNTQVVALEKDKEVVVPETEHIYKEKRKALKQTIKEVRALASEAVLEMNSNTSEEALQMAIYKLQAYKELK